MSADAESADAEGDAHFTRRFESFTDVVFGFSLSFLAGRLIIPESAGDVFAHPNGLFGFLLTFAVLAFLWLLNHRTFRHYFSPTPIDMTLVFVELCGVALMPYALQIFLRFGASPEAVVLYAVVYAVILASSAAIGFRGFRRNWQRWDPAARLRRWRTVLVQIVASAFMALGAVLVMLHVRYGPWVFWLIPLCSIYIRRRYHGLPAYARSADGAAPNVAGTASAAAPSSSVTGS